jgi:hypothetical protein
MTLRKCASRSGADTPQNAGGGAPGDIPAGRCLVTGPGLATQPMFRTTGNFTLTMGNTTWHLDDVSFLTPNPDGTGAYEMTSEPVKRTTQATAARSVDIGARSVRVVRRSDQYAVPSAVDARPTADARLRDASLKLVPGFAIRPRSDFGDAGSAGSPAVTRSTSRESEDGISWDDLATAIRLT